MKKVYKAPSVAEFGTLGELTLGILGHSPDVGGLNNDCLTAVIGTVTITCTSGPVSS